MGQTLYQLMPELSQEEYEALKADIAERGIVIPIELDEAGNILDGHHRIRAWQQLKEAGKDLPDYPRVVRAGMTEEQKRNHIRALNIIRRHLTNEQLQEQLVAMRLDGMSYQEIADTTNLGRGTVHAQIQSAFQNRKAEAPDETIGKDGKKYPAKYRKNGKPKLPAAPPVSVYAGSDEGEAKAINKAQKAIKDPNAASQEVQVTIFSSESKEYYTPPQYVDAAREVMGDIDLDPASCDIAQEWIGAKAYYTVKDDGLSRVWTGRVWLNPPYGKDGGESNQETWSQYLVREYLAGNVTEAILLVKAAMGYKWFENLWWDWPTCFARERVSFIRSDGSNDGQSKMGTAFLYLGSNVKKFKQVFRQFGRVIMPEAEDGTMPE